MARNWVDSPTARRHTRNPDIQVEMSNEVDRLARGYNRHELEIGQGQDSEVARTYPFNIPVTCGVHLCWIQARHVNLFP